MLVWKEILLQELSLLELSAGDELLNQIVLHYEIAIQAKAI